MSDDIDEDGWHRFDAMQWEQTPMTPNEEIAKIKVETFARLATARSVWIIEENGADFTVHKWSGEGAEHGAGVAPPSDYPTLRKAAARLLQLLHTGPVAPQTWPEDVCIGTVAVGDDDGQSENGK